MAAKVLIIDGGIAYGHSKGELNHALAELAKDELTAMGYEVSVTRIADGWDIAAENQKMRDADAVILQTPIWWMSTPWQVKKYFDEVFGAGMITGDGRHRDDPDVNYGTGGLLKSRYMISCTWNAPKFAFTGEKEFFEGKGIDAVMFPIHKAFQFLGMKPMKTFMANDVMKNPNIPADRERLKILLKDNFG
ncbi:MAG: NAD(P)H-dependent oxidoreductase [Sutterellaceae bacterium]|nr:NAD(P)H-dependent oxidoreductase [Sutterellaceae bacterium]